MALDPILTFEFAGPAAATITDAQAESKFFITANRAFLKIFSHKCTHCVTVTRFKRHTSRCYAYVLLIGKNEPHNHLLTRVTSAVYTRNNFCIHVHPVCTHRRDEKERETHCPGKKCQ